MFSVDALSFEPYYNEERMEQIRTLWDYLIDLESPNYTSTELVKGDWDFIIGLGCLSESIAEESAKLAIAFLNAGKSSPSIIFSGGITRAGQQQWGEGVSEAEAFKNTALGVFRAYGVSPLRNDIRILLEDKSTNTGQNILYTRDLLARMGDVKDQRLIFVHLPYMRRRLRAALEQQFPEVVGRFTVFSEQVSVEEYMESLGEEGLINNLVTQFRCVRDYPSKGFQTEQPYSSAEIDAYNILMEYTAVKK